MFDRRISEDGQFNRACLSAETGDVWTEIGSGHILGNACRPPTVETRAAMVMNDQTIENACAESRSLQSLPQLVDCRPDVK